MLMKWADQGVRDVEGTLGRAEQASAAAQRAGGRLSTSSGPGGAAGRRPSAREDRVPSPS
jgi:hypothetical protein